jgi:hypothetical protein
MARSDFRTSPALCAMACRPENHGSLIDATEVLLRQLNFHGRFCGMLGGEAISPVNRMDLSSIVGFSEGSAYKAINVNAT